MRQSALALLLVAPVFGQSAQPLSSGPRLAPAQEGATPPSTAPTPESSLLPADLTDWRLWWRQNEWFYLRLKEHILAIGTETGSEGLFLGEGTQPQTGSLRPTPNQIEKEIVPALLGVLEREKDNDLLKGALFSLAKIGDRGDPDEGARLESVIVRFLGHSSQEVHETAAIALGVLASPRSIPILAHLVWDTAEGRRAAGAVEVDYRTRSFAAYGLALVGARTDSELDRQLVVSVLRKALEGDDTNSRDLGVACLIGLGLVPLATIETPAELTGSRATPPERSRRAQLDYVLAILRDERREVLARAQCPVTLARLLPGLPADHFALYRTEIARELLARIERRRERHEVVQSCVIALGQIGTNDGDDPLDARIRRVLAGVPRRLNEPQARAFAMAAMAETGARPGDDVSSEGLADARRFLVQQINDGKNFLQPWAGLGGGVLGWWMDQQGASDPELEPLRRTLRNALEEERSPDRVGAYALGAGLAKSYDCIPRLMKLLGKELPDDTRGQVALGLALLGHEEAIAPLRAIVARSRYHPELMRQGAMALAILGDEDAAPLLASLLEDARSLSAQGAISSALGFIGDRRSVTPLLQLLGDRLATNKARAFAAVALGNVADKELLPWNAKIGIGLNYRAAPPTLTDPLTGSGILDLL